MFEVNGIASYINGIKHVVSAIVMDFCRSYFCSLNRICKYLRLMNPKTNLLTNII